MLELPWVPDQPASPRPAAPAAALRAGPAGLSRAQQRIRFARRPGRLLSPPARSLVAATKK
eukprot:4026150-Pyramimonas_sp.AAC.1